MDRIAVQGYGRGIPKAAESNSPPVGEMFFLKTDRYPSEPLTCGVHTAAAAARLSNPGSPRVVDAVSAADFLESTAPQNSPFLFIYFLMNPSNFQLPRTLNATRTIGFCVFFIQENDNKITL